MKMKRMDRIISQVPVLLLLAAIHVFPAENETGPRIVIRSSTDRPFAGSAWVLTLLIDHNDPNEVKILAPSFAGSLFLDQVAKAPRYLDVASGQFIKNQPVQEPAPSATAIPSAFEQWTAMEYRFVLNSPGTISFNAFTVTTPQGSAHTAPFQINVQRPHGTAGVQHHRLMWENTPAALAIGESAVFGLRFSGRNPVTDIPAPEMLLPSVPPGHILESLALSQQEQSAGLALKLRLIPVGTAPFALEKRQFTHNDAIFEVPALRITVNRAEGKPAATGTAEAIPAEAAFVPLFPPAETAKDRYAALYQKYRNECETVYNTALNLWENGNYADALATLRKNERDHQAGAFFAIIRRKAEQSLGLTGANDEKSRDPRSLRTRLLEALPWGKRPHTAVLRETTVHRIPDKAGTEIARFREGQPVLLSRSTETWIQVICNDGSEASGWVPKENIIIY